MTMRYIATRVMMTILAGVLFLQIGTSPCLALELDDSNLFVEAFNSYQKKDYLLTIEKVDQLLQIFPDTPLRDISLMLLARAGLKSGDNELAARTINQFSAEYADNSLKTTVEEELLALGTRKKKGEKLSPNKQLRAAAQKVRNEQLALERAAALKAEQERQAKARAERARIAAEKAEAERKERERIAAEKAAKEAIKLAIVIPEDTQQVEAGKNELLPFELVNKGSNSEEFLLATSAPKEYGVTLAAAARPGAQIERVTLAAGETLKGNILIRMPSDKVDGYKSAFQVKAVSAKYSDVSFSREARVAASAPLVRAVAKPQKAKVARGETVRYRITVLNAGSLAARGLTVRAIMPPQLDFVDAAGSDYRQESAGIVTFRVAELESGRLAEFNVNVNVRETATEKQELRLQVEVINGQLQLKDSFASSAAVVRGSVDQKVVEKGR